MTNPVMQAGFELLNLIANYVVIGRAHQIFGYDLCLNYIPEVSKDRHLLIKTLDSVCHIEEIIV